MVLVELATGTIVADPDEVATVLEPTADEAALHDAAGGNAGPIAIAFPSFTDGRGFSLARLLRERHGFKGEIRAVGHLIPDHGQFLLRSGFDTAEITDPEAVQVWKLRSSASATIISRPCAIPCRCAGMRPPRPRLRSTRCLARPTTS
ncbi:hypothetical protein AUC71_16510 [Methyloceanibacter marginalis]|uniref:DUF934 domain-containing protein n=1 Tax=Methyloceanibacter marginalis TaxID=1774971 RepID=A0A1E3W9M8_9HYPH|nr:DUF934 domain-containing protein [Methyloceanibacter marginalis]ODS02212.1 hypothetical protein AUC71_16510 [Methyloceanibacter marginalis]